MAIRKFSPARLIAVFAVVVLASTVLTGSVSAGPVADGCTLRLVGTTQYIACWNGRELESRQVPEYLVGSGVLIARQTGEVVWVPQVGEAVSVKQTDDDELIVRVARPVRLFFFKLTFSREIKLRLDTVGRVLH